jgi:SsrA-binding protein
MQHKTAYTQNRKVFFNYEVLETLEAGIELFGYESKSIKAGRANLEGAFVIIRGGEAFLMNASIPPYQQNNTPKGYEPMRMRKLMLHKKEIARLSEIEGKKSGGKTSGTRGTTVVPISLYNSAGRIKVEIAVVKGKKKHDKRASTKKRETEREMRRELK